MPKYNPNAIWDSKDKKEPARPAAQQESPKPVKKPVQTTAQKPAAPAQGQREQNEEPFFRPVPVRHFDDEEDAPKTHAFLWAAVIFVAIVGLGLLYFFLLKPQAGLNVTIGFQPDQGIMVGEPFKLSVPLTNNSQNILKDATLLISLPSDVSFVGQSPSQRVMQQTVGDIGPGSINNNTFNLIVTGSPNSVQHVDAKLLYDTDISPKTQFETDGGGDLVVGGPAVTLALNPPVNVVSGQDFDTTITYTNNTSQNFSGVELSLQYPPAFSFTRSTVQPDSAANNSWNLGTIPPAGTGTIIVTGHLVGPANASYPITASMTSRVSGETYGLTSQTANTGIGASPLSLTVTLNNSPSYIAQAGDNLYYTLAYTNNSNIAFQNVGITATLTGAMFNFATLETSGAFSSVNDTITWYAANTPALLSVAPGQSGSVTFQVQAASSYPIQFPGDKNYTLEVDAEIASPTVPAGTAASSTVSVVSVTNQVGGRITLAAKGYHNESAVGMANAGPYPPKVNQPTQYTIHWIITNYATDATNTVVTDALQSGTACTGQITSNMPTAPACNAATGMVTWAIPTVPATTGITGPPAEAIFQVTNTPAVNQVGNAVTLLGPSTLTATDAFTGQPLNASAPAVTTQLPDDTSLPQNQNRSVTN